MTQLSNTQICTLIGHITGLTVRANSKDSAIKRFVNVAAPKGLDSAKVHSILALPFERAEEAIREALAPKAKAAPEASLDLSPDEQETLARHKALVQRRQESRAKREAKTAEPASAAKALGKRAAIEDAAARGIMPTPPDFSAETHARFRKKLAELTALAEAGDIKGLKAYPINPISSSPKAMDRYRNLAVKALEARRKHPTRPGDAAAILADEGIDYATALRMTNTD